jgi:peptide/nickel transport system permease protein
MFKGDFGTTMRSGQPVTTMIWRRAPATLQLGLAAWLVSTLVGVSRGMLSASKRASIWAYIGRGLALIGQATPSFWLAILSIYIFAVYLDWLPVAGRGIDEGLGSRLKHMVLPVTVLSLDTTVGKTVPMALRICTGRVSPAILFVGGPVLRARGSPA